MLRKGTVRLMNLRQSPEPLGQTFSQVLFEQMGEGCAHCRMRFEDGVPVDWLTLAANPAFATLTGLQEVAGRWITEVVPGLRASSPDLFQTYGRVAAGGGPERFESWVEAVGRWFSVHAFSPAPGEFVVTFRNITAEKALLKALEASEARMKVLFDASPDAMTVCRLTDGAHLMVNQAWCDLTGIEAREALGRTSAELGLWTSTPDRSALLAAIRDQGQLPPRSVALLGRNGELHMLLVTTKAVAFGPETAGLTTAKVVTQARELRLGPQTPERLASRELQEEVRRRCAESLSLMAGSLAHSFSHLFRPLAARLEAARLKLPPASDLRPELSEALATLSQASALAQKLDAYLGLPRVHPEALALGGFLEGLEPELARAAGKANTFVMTLEDAPPVEADPDQLAQALRELCANAWEAMGAAGGQLGIHLHVLGERDRRCGEGVWILPRPEGPRTVCLEVTDDGPGALPEGQVRMFDPFYTTHEPGRGLGLPMVLGVLKGHQAGLQMITAPGCGVQLRLHLPPAERLS